MTEAGIPLAVFLGELVPTLMAADDLAGASEALAADDDVKLASTASVVLVYAEDVAGGYSQDPGDAWVPAAGEILVDLSIIAVARPVYCAPGHPFPECQFRTDVARDAYLVGDLIFAMSRYGQAPAPGLGFVLDYGSLAGRVVCLAERAGLLSRDHLGPGDFDRVVRYAKGWFAGVRARANRRWGQVFADAQAEGIFPPVGGFFPEGVFPPVGVLSPEGAW